MFRTSDTSLSFSDMAILLGRAVQEYYAHSSDLDKVSEDTSLANRLSNIFNITKDVDAKPERAKHETSPKCKI